MMMVVSTSKILSLGFVAAALVICSSASAATANNEDNNADNHRQYQDCSEVFVGGGWAGVYSMYRRVMADPIKASKSCLFEQSWRIGGRTYSVPVDHDDTPFVLDVGAYRFSPDMHLPGDLIMHDLKLPTECYQDTCPSAKDDFPVPFMFNYSAPLRRIVNATTKLPSGYVTPILTMIKKLETMGARVFTETSLIGIDIISNSDDYDDDDDLPQIKLQLKDMKTGIVEDIDNPDVVILNLPRNKLFEISGVEESLDQPVVDTLQCIVFDTPTDLFGDLSFDDDAKLLKAYMYFDDAFWRTKLNETVGPWPLDNHFEAYETKEGVMFNIRWHDGPVECNMDNNQKCNGLLETYYSVSDEKFYSSLAPSPNEPMGSIWMKDGPEAVEKLMTAHAGLIDILMPLLQEKGIDPNIIQPPQGLVVGVWHRPSEAHPFGQGCTAPTKVYYHPDMSGHPDEACCVPGLTDESYREIALRPWGSDIPIFLMNNDWVCGNVRYFFGDWAEESLLQAERAMLLLGLSKPDWLDEEYYKSKIVDKVAEGSSASSSSSAFSLATTTNYDNQSTRSKSAIILLGISLVVGLGLAVIVWKRRREYQKRGGKDYTEIP